MDEVVASVREVVERDGAAVLVVDDLRRDEVASLVWSGGPSHLTSVAHQVERSARGEADYLVVRGPDGTPVCKGGVDYVLEPGTGWLWQLATHPELEGLGLATRLIGALEDRVRSRGLDVATLGVEASNVRAVRLYEHLGYIAYGTRPDGWEQLDADGRVSWYDTTLTTLRKPLLVSATDRDQPGVPGGAPVPWQ